MKYLSNFSALHRIRCCLAAGFSVLFGTSSWAVVIAVPSISELSELAQFPQIAIATVQSGWDNSGGQATQEVLARALSQSRFRQYLLHQQVVRLGSVPDAAQALRNAQTQNVKAVLLTSSHKVDRFEDNANRVESVCIQRNDNVSTAKKLFGLNCERSENRTVNCSKLTVRSTMVLDLLETSSGRVRATKNLQSAAEHVNCQASDRDRNPAIKNFETLIRETQQSLQAQLQRTLISAYQSYDFALPPPDQALAAAGMAERYKTAANFLQETRYDRSCADFNAIAQAAPSSASNLRALAICDTHFNQFDSALKRFVQAESVLATPDRALGQEVALLGALASAERNFKRARPDYAAAPAPAYALNLAPAAPAQAAPAALAATPRIDAGHRVALVVGNAAYQHVGQLANPRNDAQDMQAALQRLGFEVIYLQDGNRQQMLRAINQFGSALKSNSTALVFYAGHGMQVKGANYLIPVDANPKTESEVEIESINLANILVKLEKTNINIVVLDACRNDPFKRSWRSSGGTGLASVDAPKGTLIAYATAPGSVADDGQGRNSPYTGALVKLIAQPNLKVEDVFKRVRAQVSLTTSNRQLPWESSSLVGDFYFSTAAAPQIAAASTVMPAQNSAGASRATSASNAAPAPLAASPAPDATASSAAAQASSVLSPEAQCKERGNPVSRSICERRVCERNPEWTGKPECAAFKTAAPGAVN